MEKSPETIRGRPGAPKTGSRKRALYLNDQDYALLIRLGDGKPSIGVRVLIDWAIREQLIES